jgi:hypothetical protein
MRIVLNLLMDATGKCAFTPVLDTGETYPRSARIVRWLWCTIALMGLVLSWNSGQLPERDADIARDTSPALATSSSAIAPDLALYVEVIARVRRGEDYYAVAAEAIPSHGFPTSSPLNWRLPTYAWLLSRLPCAGWIQLTLMGLSLIALAATFASRVKGDGALCAGVTTLLMIGVLRWSADGYACVAQEPWAATFMVLALAAYGAGERRGAFRYAAIGLAIAALFFRELVLPFCGIGCLVALYQRRFGEVAAWMAGMALFFAFYAWHVGQVRAQLALSGAVAAPDVGQWLRLGGLDFVLLSLRMNGLLFQAPGIVLWLFLLAALVGAGIGRGATQPLVGLATAAYVVAFAFLGRPENFYWGLIPAPLLAWSVGSLPLNISAPGMRDVKAAAMSASSV